MLLLTMIYAHYFDILEFSGRSRTVDDRHQTLMSWEKPLNK